MDPHSEIELKFISEKSYIKPFLCWAMDMAFGPSRYVHVKCPDIYYRRGDDVLRHRHSEGAGELTVKLRKSVTSTTDRVEIDWKFADSMKYEDIAALLLATGWEVDLRLDKDAHVFWFDEPNFTSTLSIYTVNNKDVKNSERTFIEIEIEKSSNLDPQQALFELNEWGVVLMQEFLLEKPINQSLYEIYTGKKYKLC